MYVVRLGRPWFRLCAARSRPIWSRLLRAGFSAMGWSVWLCMGARSVTDKILAILFPITAFVACGFEHSVANMYFLPIGVALAAGTSAPLSVTEAVSNLALVTIGNVLGGTVLVALVYWAVYLRNSV